MSATADPPPGLMFYIAIGPGQTAIRAGNGTSRSFIPLRPCPPCRSHLPSALSPRLPTIAAAAAAAALGVVILIRVGGPPRPLVILIHFDSLGEHRCDLSVRVPYVFRRSTGRRCFVVHLHQLGFNGGNNMFPVGGDSTDWARAGAFEAQDGTLPYMVRAMSWSPFLMRLLRTTAPGFSFCLVHTERSGKEEGANPT